VQVEFRLKLRDERKFDSFDELKLQIDRDAAAAREYLLPQRTAVSD
jgi:riboflavin kinase / FMN adenylyltransferase